MMYFVRGSRLEFEALGVYAYTGSCWTDVVIFLYHLGVCNEVFTLYVTGRAWVFDNICVFDTIEVYIPCKKPSYLGTLAVVSI